MKLKKCKCGGEMGKFPNQDHETEWLVCQECGLKYPPYLASDNLEQAWNAHRQAVAMVEGLMEKAFGCFDGKWKTHFTEFDSLLSLLNGEPRKD